MVFVRAWMRGLLAALLVLPVVARADFQGRVVRVSDGDTVTVLRQGSQGPEQVRVRLASIDAPERRQAFGNRSRQHLAELVFDRRVTVLEQGSDRYGRTIGVIEVDGGNANQQMVRAGLAWAYTDYARDYEDAEREAQIGGRGFWAGEAQPAWEWRRQRRRRIGPQTGQNPGLTAP